MVTTVIFSLYLQGLIRQTSLLLSVHLCSSSGQVKKLSVGKVPISGNVVRAWDVSAIVELGSQTWGRIRTLSKGALCVFVIRNWHINEREFVRHASALCVVDLTTWCRYTCLLFTDLDSFFLVLSAFLADGVLFLSWLQSFGYSLAFLQCFLVVTEHSDFLKAVLKISSPLWRMEGKSICDHDSALDITVILTGSLQAVTLLASAAVSSLNIYIWSLLSSCLL